LVGERTRHDEGRVAGGTAQIQQAATSKNNDTVMSVQNAGPLVWR
jgi:hypothetical protein